MSNTSVLAICVVVASACLALALSLRLLLGNDRGNRNDGKQHRRRRGQRLQQPRAPARSLDEVARCRRQFLGELDGLRLRELPDRRAASHRLR